MNFSFADFLDILLTALLIYYAFKYIRGTSAMNILIGLIFLFVLKVLVSAMGMKMMTEMLSIVLDVGMLAIIVIFQPEIRRFLIHFGQRYLKAEQGRRIWERFAKRSHDPSSLSPEQSAVVKEIAEACNSMSATKTGALIVLAGRSSLESVIDTGDRIDAVVNRRLLMNLFFKNSPLHDGAVVISSGRIAAARCTLPITEKTNIPASFGMRHKAAAGITEDTDAKVVVVSEETGGITFFNDGSWTHINNLNELKLLLGQALG